MSDSDKTDRRKFLGGLLGVPLLAASKASPPSLEPIEVTERMKKFKELSAALHKANEQRKARLAEVQNKITQLQAQGTTHIQLNLDLETKARFQTQLDQHLANIDHYQTQAASYSQRLKELQAARRSNKR